MFELDGAVFSRIVLGMHVFLPDMLARNSGHMVNGASMAAKVTTPEIALYCAPRPLPLG